MKKKCSLCDEDTHNLYQIMEEYVLDLIKAQYPEWIEPDGACSKCIEYYYSLDNVVVLAS